MKMNSITNPPVSSSIKMLVVLPTYNEIANLKTIVPLILEQHRELKILIVDDNSPDGTGKLADKLAEQYAGRVFVMHRQDKRGLGAAYVAGFKWALQHGAELIFQMDADLSHDPTYIRDFLNAIQDADLVIGSRYIQGANVVNWPLKRLLLSYYANVYTRIITGMPLHDATGGFKCFKRHVLEAIQLDHIHSNGYSFQIEMNFNAFRKKFKIKEIPIIFYERSEGKSKMSGKIVREAIWMVWKLRWLALIGKL